MDLEIFDKMKKEDLRKYIEFLLWHYRVIDAFWYIYITEEFDRSGEGTQYPTGFAPAPDTTTLRSASDFSTNSAALRSAAPLMMAVPCTSMHRSAYLTITTFTSITRHLRFRYRV